MKAHIKLAESIFAFSDKLWITQDEARELVAEYDELKAKAHAWDQMEELGKTDQPAMFGVAEGGYWWAATAEGLAGSGGNHAYGGTPFEAWQALMEKVKGETAAGIGRTRP